MLGYVCIITFILLILVSVLICLLAINKKCYLGGGQLATLNNENLIKPMLETNSILETKPMLETTSMLETKPIITNKEPQKKPSIEELDILFPIYDRTHTYTYEELLQLYYEFNSPIEPLNSDQLLIDYVHYLENEVNKKTGGDCTDFASTIKSQLETDPSRVNRLYPPTENYAIYSWQHLTKLKDCESNVYGMQNPYVSNCETMYKFLRFLKSNNIKYIVCLHSNGEPIRDLCEIGDTLVFFNKSITDGRPMSYEIGMSIIALIENIGQDAIVFYCTAGFGRTGSVMYLIYMYLKCKKNRSILTNILPYGREIVYSEYWLSDVYSLKATEELFHHGPIFKAINVINLVIAQSLDIYCRDVPHTPIRYMQYSDALNPTDQVIFNITPIEDTMAERIKNLAYKINVQKLNYNMDSSELSIIILTSNDFDKSEYWKTPLSGFFGGIVPWTAYMYIDDKTQYVIDIGTLKTVPEFNAYVESIGELDKLEHIKDSIILDHNNELVRFEISQIEIDFYTIKVVKNWSMYKQINEKTYRFAGIEYPVYFKPSRFYLFFNESDNNRSSNSKKFLEHIKKIDGEDEVNSKIEEIKKDCYEYLKKIEDEED